MDKHTKRNLEKLDKQIKQMLSSGDRGAAAELYGRQAALYLNSGEFGLAAAAFNQAAELAAEDGEIGAEAHIRYAQGMTLEHVDGMRDDAVSILTRSAKLYAQVDKSEHSAKAYHRIANLHIGVANFDAAGTTIARALETIDSEASPALAVQLYRQQASLHWMHDRFDEAQQGLEKALAVAKASQDEAAITAIQAELVAIQQDSGNEKAEDKTADPFASLLQVGMQTGNLQVVTDIQLQQAATALQNSNYKEAEAKANEARQSATQATDMGRYLRYLTACIIISLACEAMDDRPGVIAILLTCKHTLTRQLGPEVGGQVTQLLDALPLRWGADGLQAALQVYRQRMKEAGH